jgi:hypothetical protein
VQFPPKALKVPQLTVGSNVRGGCEPAHMGGWKSLRSTPQMCKEACEVRAGSKGAVRKVVRLLPVFTDKATLKQQTGLGFRAISGSTPDSWARLDPRQTLSASES